MTARGWYVQPQFGFESSPANLHMTVTASNHGTESTLLDALAESVAAARRSGPVTLAPELVSAIASLDPAELTSEQFAGLLAMAGLEGSGTPDRMAEINSMLAAAPPPLRERLLVEFLGVLYTPQR
jgi:hypothetical protein